MLTSRLGAAGVSGLVYFAMIFALAFATGAARVLVLAPRIGPTAAVLIEVPLLILASWIIARRLLRHRRFTAPQRAVMGGVAFALLMASEAALSAILRGESLTDWARGLATPLGLVGLAGQIAFGLMPLSTGRPGPPSA